MPVLNTSSWVLQDGVMLGPATVVLADKTDVESMLRERTTLAWKKNATEAPYDFPNSYVTIPQRVMTWNPTNTSVEDQNTRFVQRYFAK